MMDLKTFVNQMLTPGTVPCTLFGMALGLIFAVLCLTIGGGAALLHLQVIRQTEHILLDRPKAHKAVKLCADRFRSPHIWKWEDNMWKLRHTPYEGDSEVLWGDPRGTHHEI